MEDSAHVGVDVFIGVDIAKGDHYACAATADGREVLAHSVSNDEAAIGRLIDDAAAHGAVALVIDTTSSAASLLLEAAARREVPVAYVTGLAMRRAADLYAGAAKTDPKDAAVLADYARRNADRLSWTAPSDKLLARLRILNGRDADLAADATRAANRLRDALVAVSPALERAVGDKLSSNPGARDALARWGTLTALRAARRARIRGRLAAYAGLAPVDWQSGRSATVRKPRGGNHRLKNAMFIAAFVATQHDPDARAYYQRKRSERKRHNAAVICVARRRDTITRPTNSPVTDKDRERPGSEPNQAARAATNCQSLSLRTEHSSERTAGDHTQRHTNNRCCDRVRSQRRTRGSRLLCHGPPHREW